MPLIRTFRTTIALILTACLGLVLSPGRAAAATATLDFTVTGLTATTAVQNFDYLGTDQAFVTQRTTAATVLTRCVLSGRTCARADSVTLAGYGHGESLEAYVQDGRILLWVGSSAGPASQYWSTRVSLIEYHPAAGGQPASFTRLGSLIGLAAVAPGYSGEGVRVAVATADGDDRIGLRVQVGATGSSSYYGIFDTSALTAAMLAAAGQQLSIASVLGDTAITKSRFKEPSRPHGSFQGFDIVGVGSGNKYLYVYGGGNGQTPTIYSFLYTNGGNTTQGTTYTVDGIGTPEAEGVKVETDPLGGGVRRIMVGVNKSPFPVYHLS
ncbi:helveticin J family class III bacteriocin [Microlunatus speluncae]|uniref:helveticin J family class III bacteriocin n=1 Tax=Microlunatus speluncae TaxID=2594267 RepID=UPI001266263E|nr:helveticin J family class III bacteriocin [Microlunatus speluncae]